MLDEEEILYVDFVESGKTMAKYLKGELGCDIVIALTHMRVPNDIKLAEEAPEIDLILGGHDHVYEKYFVNETLMLKSGADFRNFSFLKLSRVD